MSTKKFRPYLTLLELKHLLEVLKTSRDSRSVPLIKYLETYVMQIDAGVRKENLSLKPTIESLILASPETESFPVEKLLQEFNLNGFKNLSLAEISALNNYRYDKQLMSPEEESEYESKLMGF